jgi:hypothetical protein
MIEVVRYTPTVAVGVYLLLRDTEDYLGEYKAVVAAN